MKRFISGFLLVALFFGAVAHAADLQKGLEAYQRGDYKTALEELEPLAEKNNKDAQFVLGVMYQSGLGVPKHNEDAIIWYRLAAHQGHAKAQHELGYAHITGGSGVKPSHKQAIKWFTLAAEQGLAESQNSLGVIYLGGQAGAKQDIKKASQWFKKAAEQGLVEAQHGLGVTYLVGQNLPVDEIKAYIWLKIAAERKHLEAKKILATLEKRISKADLATAKKRIKKCIESDYKNC